MKRFRSSRKKANGMALDGQAIAFHSHVSGWLRWLIAGWFGLISGVFVTVFIVQWQQIDWTNRPHFHELLLAILFFLIFPLSIGMLALYYALFAKSIELRLDPGTGEAVLKRKGLTGEQTTHYPLGAVEIATIRLKAENPAYDEPEVALQMPDGLKVELSCFADDGQAKAWIARIRRVISAHADNSDGSSLSARIPHP